MDLERVEALLKLMHRYGVSTLDWSADGTRLRLRLQSEPDPVRRAPRAPAASPVPVEVAEPDAEGVLVNSPMVGTFYRAPKPGSPPFVEVGERVQKGQVLCIIEAMKLMNELECEVEGTVEEIRAESGQPVQFGQPLFRILPE